MVSPRLQELKTAAAEKQANIRGAFSSWTAFKHFVQVADTALDKHGHAQVRDALRIYLTIHPVNHSSRMVQPGATKTWIQLRQRKGPGAGTTIASFTSLSALEIGPWARQ